MFRPHPAGCNCPACFVQPAPVYTTPVVTPVPVYNNPYTMFGGASMVNFGFGHDHHHHHGHDHHGGWFGHGGPHFHHR